MKETKRGKSKDVRSKAERAEKYVRKNKLYIFDVKIALRRQARLINAQCSSVIQCCVTKCRTSLLIYYVIQSDFIYT